MTPVLLVVGARAARATPSGIAVERVSAGKIAEAAARSIAAGHDRIGVVGGDADAAVVAGVAADLGRRIGLAVVPRRHSDLNATFAVAGDHVRRLHEGDRYPIDLGYVEGSWGRTPFLNGVVIGLPAGRLGLTALAPISRGPVTVDTERPLRVEGAVGVLVMNGQHWSGLTVAPRATLIDGILDLQVLTAARRRIPALTAAMRRGLHLARRDVTRRRVSEARLGVPPRWPVAADGRRIGRGPVGVSVLPGAVDLLI